MEQYKLQQLLAKYENAETTVEEERELKKYFASNSDRGSGTSEAFNYFHQQQSVKMKAEIKLPPKEKKRMSYLPWLAAAAVVAMVGIGFLFNNETTEKQELGTYNSPEVAFAKTQQALNMLSGNMNVGLAKVQYAAEYNETTEIVFKKTK